MLLLPCKYNAKQYYYNIIYLIFFVAKCFIIKKSSSNTSFLISYNTK